MRNLNLFTGLIFLMILLPKNTMADLRSAAVDGYAFLQDQSDHSGVAVVFTAESPSAFTDTFYTNASGSFTAGITEGLYSVKYVKEHYVTIHLPDIILFDADVSLEDKTLQGPYIELSGSVSGTLEESYRYLVVQNIWIPTNDSLIITGGVELYFSPGTHLGVSGVLKTNVSGTDSILFTSLEANPGIAYWSGINFTSSIASNSVLSNIKIEYADVAITCSSSSPTINDNIFRNNSIGIELSSSSSPVISDNLIETNSNQGIRIHDSSPTISNNTIRNNSIGVEVGGSSSLSQITNNVIEDNNAQGILINASASPTISNNTISNNHDGIKVMEVFWNYSPVSRQSNSDKIA